MQYGTMTESQASAAICQHDIEMRRNWVRRCVEYMEMWESVRTPARWHNMSEYHRGLIIRGWIYKRIMMQGGRQP